MTLKIGVGAVPVTKEGIEYVVEAERLGVDSVWVPEFWGYDALTPLGALAVATDTIKLGTGIVQLGSRTPAMLAMSAMSLQTLSDGRFRLGIGASGPQVVEGWHGVRFGKPVQRTRETIEIIRIATSGERLAYDGRTYQLPLPDSEGRSIRAAAPPVDVPVYVASLGPANLRLTGELAQGWIGNTFFPETADVYFDEIAAGADLSVKNLDDIDLTVAASVEFTDNFEEAAQRHASGYAFTIGAMGSGKSNFYNEAFTRNGFGDDVVEVERLWRGGDKEAARARVPAAIGSGTNLIGDDTQITERLRLHKSAGVNTIRANPQGATTQERLDCLGRLLDLVATVNSEV
jgi:F420-dependent oxidoreductase-like protein